MQPAMFRVFVSSTFQDFRAERDALRRRVVPALQAYCAGFGARFELVDLRWGVNEQEGRQHGTLDLCLAEIRRCQAITPRPNFLVLLGWRYGWRPLPTRLDGARAAELASTLKKRGDKGAALAAFNRRYQEDRELLDPKDLTRPASPWQVLRPIPGDEQAEAEWAVDDALLRTAIDEAAVSLGLSAEDGAVLFGSATHQEVLLGMKGEMPRPLLAYRPDPSCAPASGSATLDPRMLGLRTLLIDGAEDAHVLTPEDEAAGLTAFTEWVEFALRSHIDASRAGLQPATPADAAARVHRAFGIARTSAITGGELRRVFVGRDADLDGWQVACQAWHGGVRTLLVAPGGAGKTAFLAALSERLASRGVSAHTFYVGATPASLTTAGLLEEVGATVAGATGLVLIDGLDQLGPDIVAGLFADTAWRDSPVLATCRTDGPGQLFADAWRAQGGLVQVLSDTVDAGAVLDAWTRTGVAPRVLAGDRRRAVLAALGPAPTMLAARLAAGIAEGGATDLMRALPLAGATTRQWAAAALSHVETRLTRVFVRRATEYLALSRLGLTYEELAELLSSDPDVIMEFGWTARPEWEWSEMGLPPILLSRLHGMLDAVLVAGAVDGGVTLRFLHREINEAVLDGLADRAGTISARLAGYFCRALSRQHIGTTPAPALRRALFEGPRALIAAGDGAATMVLLSQFHVLHAKVRAGMVDDLLTDLRLAIVTEPALNPVRDWLIDHRAMLGGTHPATAFLQVAIEAASDLPVRLGAKAYLSEPGHRGDLHLVGQQKGAPTARLRFDAGNSTGLDWSLHPDCVVCWAEDTAGDRTAQVWRRDDGTLLALLRYGTVEDGVPGRPWWVDTIETAPAGPGMLWTWALAPAGNRATGQVRLWSIDGGGLPLGGELVRGLRFAVPLAGGALLTADRVLNLAIWQSGHGAPVMAWSGQIPDRPGSHVLHKGWGLVGHRTVDGLATAYLDDPATGKAIPLRPAWERADAVRLSRCGPDHLVAFRDMPVLQDTGETLHWLEEGGAQPAPTLYYLRTGGRSGLLGAHVAAGGMLHTVVGLHAAADGSLLVWGGMPPPPGSGDGPAGLDFAVVRCRIAPGPAELVVAPGRTPEHVLKLPDGGVVFCLIDHALVFVPSMAGDAVRMRTNPGDRRAEVLADGTVATWCGFPGTGSEDVTDPVSYLVHLWTAGGHALGTLDFGEIVGRVVTCGTTVGAEIGTQRFWTQPITGRVARLAPPPIEEDMQNADESDYRYSDPEAFELPPGMVRDLAYTSWDLTALVGREIIRHMDGMCCVWGSAVVAWSAEDAGLAVYEAWCGTHIGTLPLDGDCLGLASFADGLLLAWTAGVVLFAQASGPVRARVTRLPGHRAPDWVMRMEGDLVLAGYDAQCWSCRHGGGDWETHAITPDQQHSVYINTLTLHQDCKVNGGLLAHAHGGQASGLTLMLPPPNDASPLRWEAPTSVVSFGLGSAALDVVLSDGTRNRVMLHRGGQPCPDLWTLARRWINPGQHTAARLCGDAATLYAGALALLESRPAEPAGSATAFQAALQHWAVAASCPDGVLPDVALARRLWDEALRHGPASSVDGPLNVRLLARMVAVLRRGWLREQAVACGRLAAAALDQAEDRGEAWISAAAALAEVLQPLDAAEAARLAEMAAKGMRLPLSPSSPGKSLSPGEV